MGTRRRTALVFAACAYLSAGLLFVLLSVFCGFAFLTAHGVDVRVADADAQRVQVTAVVTWVVGFISAVAGLATWIAAWTRGRTGLRWAVVDVIVMAAALLVLTVIVSLPSQVN